jgi:hypothetical protein
MNLEFLAYPQSRNRSDSRKQNRRKSSDSILQNLIPDNKIFQLNHSYEKLPVDQRQELIYMVDFAHIVSNFPGRKTAYTANNIVSEDTIEKLAKSNLGQDLISLMWDKVYTEPLEQTREYRIVLAMLFTKLPIQAMNPNLQEEMRNKIDKNASPVNFDLLPYYSRWFLCDASEERMQDAMDARKDILLNGSLLMKPKRYGTKVGLPEKTFITDKGFIMMKGVWYQPLEKIPWDAVSFQRINDQERLTLIPHRPIVLLDGTDQDYQTAIKQRIKDIRRINR